MPGRRGGQREETMIRILLATCVVLGMTAAPPALAEPSLADLAARVELRAIETLTLSDEQFLNGDKNGKPTLIAGELRLPRGGTGKLPAVVLLHGSGGI